jgi:hypothetical protein
MAGASFDFQIADRQQIRRIVTPDSFMCEPQSVLRSQPPHISRWYLLGHLGAFNRQLGEKTEISLL